MAKKIKGVQILRLPTYQLDKGVLTPGKESVILKGWGFITIPSAISAVSANVSFGVTFASPPTVLVSTLGYKSGSDLTSISDNAGIAGEIVRGGQNTNTTKTSLYVQNATATNMTSGTRVLYNILVIGELA